MKNTLHKLSSHTGESIAETLIALLIAAVVLTMLASMISSTLSLVKTSEKKLTEYYASSENLEKQETSFLSNAVISITGNQLSVSVDGITIYQNDTFGGTTKAVYTYEKPAS